MSQALSGSVGSYRQVKTPSGAPCFTAASYIICTAFCEQRHARGSIEPLGLGSSDFAILELLLHKGQQPVNAIGRRLDLNPIVVLVALWMGGWLWGIAGVVVALPTLLATKVAASHSARGGAVVRFLSPNRRPQRPWEGRIARRDAVWQRAPR